MEDLRNKDKSIIYIYQEIVKKVGESYFEIVDYWDGDKLALGLQKNDKLIYISTWANKKGKLHEKNEDLKYYLSLEVLDMNKPNELGICENFENISENELSRLILVFVDFK